MQNFTGEEIVDMPIPQIRKENGEVIQLIPIGRISDHVVEQTVAVQIPRVTEEILEDVKPIPPELTDSNGNCEVE